MTVLCVSNHDLPYVSLNAAFRAGAALAPPDRAGLAYLTANLLERGTTTMSRDQVAAAFDALGTGFGSSVGNEAIQFSADCSRENLPRLVALFKAVLGEPACAQDELDRLRRQTVAEVVDLKDDDGSAARLFFGQQVFANHAYGIPVRGFAHSLAGIDRALVTSFRERYLSAANLVLGVSGDIREEEAIALRDELAEVLPPGESAPATPPGRLPERDGLDLLLVTRSDRSQAQVFLGQQSLPASAPGLVPARVAVAGFGGTFTAPLVREIREKRGWSYGVSASLAPGLRGGLFSIRFAPRNQDLVPAIRLTLELLDGFRDEGLSADDLAFAREYLVNRFPFQVESAPRRLDLLLNVLLTGKPADYAETYVDRVRTVEPEAARQAVAAFLRPHRSALTVLGDPGLAEPLAALPGVRRLRTVPVSWDGVLPEE